jgi:hypothetical protein
MRFFLDIDGCLLDTDDLHVDAYARVTGIKKGIMKQLYPAIAWMDTKMVLDDPQNVRAKQSYAYNSFCNLVGDKDAWLTPTISALRVMTSLGDTRLCSNASLSRQREVKQALMLHFGISVMAGGAKSVAIRAAGPGDLLIDNSRKYLNMADTQGARAIYCDATSKSWSHVLDIVSGYAP